MLLSYTALNLHADKKKLFIFPMDKNKDAINWIIKINFYMLCASIDEYKWFTIWAFLRGFCNMILFTLRVSIHLTSNLNLVFLLLGLFGNDGCRGVFREGEGFGCGSTPFLEKFIQFARVFWEKNPKTPIISRQYKKISKPPSKNFWIRPWMAVVSAKLFQLMTRFWVALLLLGTPHVVWHVVWQSHKGWNWKTRI